MDKIENPRAQKEIEAEFEQLRPEILGHLYAKYAKNEARSTPHDERRTINELNTASAQSDPLYAAITRLTRNGPEPPPTSKTKSRKFASPQDPCLTASVS